MAYKDYRDIFRQMEREMQQLSDEVFRGFFDMPGSAGRFWSPAIDIYESESDLLVKIELPGVRPHELSVSVSADDRALTIGGIRREPEEERRGRLRCHQLEIYFGPFERTIALPTNVRIDREDIKAVYREGFLLVTLPKIAMERTPTKRTIPITNGEGEVEAAEQQPGLEEETTAVH
jgi:HSP20 family protein